MSNRGYNQHDAEPDELNVARGMAAELRESFAENVRLTAENAKLRGAARAYLNAEWVLRDEPDRRKLRLDAALAEDALRAALAEVSNIESSGILALIKP